MGLHGIVRDANKVCVCKIQRKMITKIQRTTGKNSYGPLVIYDKVNKSVDADCRGSATQEAAGV
jgi:hypothetical protein